MHEIARPLSTMSKYLFSEIVKQILFFNAGSIEDKRMHCSKIFSLLLTYLLLYHNLEIVIPFE
jgi:hypothetical protein